MSVGIDRAAERTRYAEGLRAALADVSGPTLVHSDVAQAIGAVAPTRDRATLLARHADLLEAVAGDRPLWVPVFHYGFTRTRRFDVTDDPSEVGALSEHVRTQRAQWRTEVPVFSVAGTGTRPDVPASGTVDPFDAQSAFGRLADADGALVFHGAPFASCTFIHHVERLAGGPVYRYDKDFAGEVVAPHGTHACVLRYHVRPMGRHLEYDWPRLEADLAAAGVLRQVVARGARARVLRARDLRSFWAERLAEDPLHLLDADSRAWVAPEFERLHRRFRIADFEDG